MTEDRFWQIVQRSVNDSNGDLDEQAEILGEELESLSPEEIASFDKHFEHFRRRTACACSARHSCLRR